MDREEVGSKIMEVAQDCSDGHRRGISLNNLDIQNEVQEKCAVAASNTGWLILDALGFTDEEKYRLMDKHRKEHSDDVK